MHIYIYTHTARDWGIHEHGSMGQGSDRNRLGRGGIDGASIHKQRPGPYFPEERGIRGGEIYRKCARMIVHGVKEKGKKDMRSRLQQVGYWMGREILREDAIKAAVYLLYM